MANVTTYERLRMLPPGSAVALGWIREQLLRAKDGMSGHLDELEPEMIRDPYLRIGKHANLGESIAAGWGAEQSGNYWYGLIQLAFALDDDELKAKAENWVNGVLANQRDDGYLGTYTDANNYLDDFNGWGTASGLNALQAYSDATGREDIVQAVYRCLLWFCDKWSGDNKTRYCGQALVFNMAWGHRHTGDPRLLQFIDEYFDFLNRNDIAEISINALRSPKLTYNAFHNAGLAWLPKFVAAGYMATGNPDYLDAVTNLMRKIKDKILLPTGGLSTNTEYTSPIAANTETECCAFSLFQNALIWLGSITGDPQYYDIVERIAFNGAQGARKSDEKAIAYFTSPNQIFATSNSDFMGDDMGLYAPCYPTACCPVASTWLMPDYLQGMGLTDDAGNAYISSYGPARLRFGDLELVMDTQYPFRDAVRITVSAKAPVEKSIHLRIPGWCTGAQISVNGKEIASSPKPDSFFELAGPWTGGDVIELRLPMKVVVKQLNDDDSWRHHPLVFEYGPLVFSLPIPEHWRIVKGRPHTPLPEDWHWYEVIPQPVSYPPGDVFEQPCLRKHAISWNVAFDEHIDPESIQIEQHEGGYVWENPQLTLRLPGYKALYSYAPYARKTHSVYQAPIDVDGELDLTLVPYGCTALRITCFPRANLTGADT